MMNLPTIQQVSLQDSLEIVPYFDGSSKVPLTIFIEACKKVKEMVLNEEGNLIKLLRNKLTGEARRCIMENYYNNLDDFISKHDFMKMNEISLFVQKLPYLSYLFHIFSLLDCLLFHINSNENNRRELKTILQGACFLINSIFTLAKRWVPSTKRPRQRMLARFS